jgi:hypothetical protein
MANCEQVLQEIVQQGRGQPPGQGRPYLVEVFRLVGTYHSYGDGLMTWHAAGNEEKLYYFGHFTAITGDILTRPLFDVSIDPTTSDIAIADYEHMTLTLLQPDSVTCEGDANSLLVTGQEVLTYGKFPGPPPEASIRLTGLKLNVQGLSLNAELSKRLGKKVGA